MGRKNSKVRRRNERGNLMRGGVSPRVSVDDIVLPDGQCWFRVTRKPKARFATEEKAAKALMQARAQRIRTKSQHIEKRYYACPEGGCGGFHLTSREEYDESAYEKRQGRGL